MRLIGFFGGLLIALLATLPLSARADGRILRVAISGSDVTTLDPHKTSATTEMVPIGWMFGGLTRFKPGSADPAALEGDLAESWRSSPDGLVWTFKLRKGVMFHAGFGEVTADDVVYSLTRAADPKRSAFSAEFKEFSKVEALAPDSVRVTLSAPVPNLPGLVSNYHGGQIISRKAEEKLGDAFRQRPVGFGPFEFGSHDTQQRLTLKGFAQYYRGEPKLDEIQYIFIPADTARELAFTAGEIDAFDGRRDQRWVERMKKLPDTIVDVFRPGEFRALHINRHIKPLDDVRVREAVARAIDTKTLQRYVGADVADLGRSVVPPGYLGEITDGPYPAFDLAKSRALLAEAGFANGLRLHAVVSNISAQQPVMEAIQAMLKKAGIELEMEIVDHSTYHAKVRQDVSALVFYGAARFPVADAYLAQFFHSRAEIGAPQQITNFSHCAVADREIDAARIEPDPVKQLALWRVAQEKIARDVCAVPLFDLKQVWVRKAAVDYGYTLDGSLNLAPPMTEAASIK